MLRLPCWRAFRTGRSGRPSWSRILPSSEQLRPTSRASHARLRPSARGCGLPKPTRPNGRATSARPFRPWPRSLGPG
eukprot:6507060-Alexandrium_andersonii.AAC.1